MEEIIDSAPRHPTRPETYWCENCQAWVHRSEMHSVPLDDDVTTEKWCKDCGRTLLIIKIPET